MARSELSDSAAGRRILENVQSRRTKGTSPTADDAERLLSRPIAVGKSKRRSRRKKRKPSLASFLFKLLVVGAAVWLGISAIVWLRDFAFDFGIVWIGDR